jgi:hypothetical protein
MNRRGFVGVAGVSLALLSSQPAFPQEPTSIDVSLDDLFRLVTNPVAIGRVLAEMDALWIVLVEGNPTTGAGSFGEARSSYLRYRSQLNPDTMPRVRAGIESGDWMQTMAQLDKDLQPILIRLRQQIIENGINETSRLVTVFLRAFNTFTKMLRALSADNDAWYCHCYGLELLCR